MVSLSYKKVSREWADIVEVFKKATHERGIITEEELILSSSSSVCYENIEAAAEAKRCLKCGCGEVTCFGIYVILSQKGMKI